MFSSKLSPDSRFQNLMKCKAYEAQIKNSILKFFLSDFQHECIHHHRNHYHFLLSKQFPVSNPSSSSCILTLFPSVRILQLINTIFPEFSTDLLLISGLSVWLKGFFPCFFSSAELSEQYPRCHYGSSSAFYHFSSTPFISNSQQM